MTPIGRVVWGHLLAIVDVRVEGFDVVPDPLGWLLVVTGCLPLGRRHALFRGAAVAAVGALVLSVGEVDGQLGELLGLVYAALQTAVVVCVCTALVHVVGGRHGRSANAIRWLDLGLLAVLVVAAVAGTDREVRVHDAAAALVLLLVALALGIAAWFLLTLHAVRHHPELSGSPAPAMT